MPRVQFPSGTLGWFIGILSAIVGMLAGFGFLWAVEKMGL